MLVATIVAALVLVGWAACSLEEKAATRTSPPAVKRPQAPSSSATEAAGPVDTTPYSWAHRYRMIAHGMGAIGGVGQSNTREAFLRSYERGYRIFEVDLVFTRDGQLVARHDWTKARYQRFGQTPPSGSLWPTLAQFKAMKVKGKYTPLSAADVVELMRTHPDAWVMTDIKDGSVKGRLHALRELLDAAGDDTSIGDRIIVQIYSEKDLAPTRALGFKNIIYTFYRLETPVQRAVEFSSANKIKVVTFPKSLATRSLIRELRSRGIRCATHTVNDPDEEAGLYKLGVRLFYTDRLTP